MNDKTTGEQDLRLDALAVKANEIEARYDAVESLRFLIDAWMHDPNNAAMLAKLNITGQTELLAMVMSHAAMGAADSVRGCVAIDWPSRKKG